jgi:hypothetical protein
MEEFVQQEAKDLAFALTRGVDIVWPTSCRNCDFEFSSNLKSVVCKALLKDPLADVLKIVSSSMESSCKGHNYCCINNFKPTYKKPFVPPSSGATSYYVCTENLMVEEGLIDWYDISWDDDEESSLVPQPSFQATPPREFSLFDIVSS